MTVQELITHLEAIEDKTMNVISITDSEDWSPAYPPQIIQTMDDFPYMKEGDSPNPKYGDKYPLVIL